MKKKDSLIGRSLSDFKESRKFYRISITSLSVAVLLLTWALTSRDSTTIIVPSGFSEPLEITGNQANEHYKIRWAWSIATLAGNIHPSNALFVANQIEDLLAPYLRAELRQMLQQEARMVQLRDVRQSFVIDDAIFDPPKNLVWVTGQRIIQSARNQRTSNRFTYEMRIESRNGRPYITHFTAYDGAPRGSDEYTVTPNPFLSDELRDAIRNADPDKPLRIPVYETTPKQNAADTDKENTKEEL